MGKTFPNYFAQLLEPDIVVKNQAIIEQYIQSVLDRISIPHMTTEGISTEHFFNDLVEKANDLAKEKNCGIKIELYLAGGVVRSLLGYMYKLVHEREDIPDKYTKPLPEVIKATEEEATKTSTSLSEEHRPLIPDLKKDSVAMQQFDKKKKLLSGAEFHLKQASLAEKELLPSPFVLGVGSDLDCFYQIKRVDSNDNTPLSPLQIYAGKEIAAELESYINNTAEQSGLQETLDPIKNSILPLADVAEINEHEERALAGGGSLMDALAFRLENDPEKRKQESQLRFPAAHQDILQDFLAGTYEYIEPTVGEGTKAIRGLRALVEIPFLEVKDPKVLIDELKIIIADIKSGKGLQENARKQFEKLVRNAQFQLAVNRPYREDPESPMGLALQIANALYEEEGSLTNKVRFLLPIFLQKMSLDNRSDEEIISQTKPGNYEVLKSHLMPHDTFIQNHTDKGILYHGTSSEAGICVLRGGFVLSTKKQGAALFGPGVYSTPDYNIASDYAAGGMILPLNVTSQNLKIVDWDTLPASLKKNLENEAEESGYEHVFDMLKARDKYGVDVIICGHVLIQNQSAIDLELSLEAMLDWILSSAPKKINAFDDVVKYFRSMVQYKLYYELFKSIGVNVSQKMEPQQYYESRIKLLQNIDLNWKNLDPDKSIDPLTLHELIKEYTEICNILLEMGFEMKDAPSLETLYQNLLIPALLESDEADKKDILSIANEYYEVPSVYNTIIQKIGFTESDFMRSIYSGDKELFDFIIDKLEDFNFVVQKCNYQRRPKNGIDPVKLSKWVNSQANYITPLSEAVESGQTEMAKILIEKGAKIDEADFDGNTPLMLSAENGNVELVETLLAMGASPEQQNRDGQSAIDMTNNPEIKDLFITNENKTFLASMSSYGLFKKPKEESKEFSNIEPHDKLEI